MVERHCHEEVQERCRVDRIADGTAKEVAVAWDLPADSAIESDFRPRCTSSPEEDPVAHPASCWDDARVVQTTQQEEEARKVLETSEEDDVASFRRSAGVRRKRDTGTAERYYCSSRAVYLQRMHQNCVTSSNNNKESAKKRVLRLQRSNCFYRINHGERRQFNRSEAHSAWYVCHETYSMG